MRAVQVLSRLAARRVAATASVAALRSSQVPASALLAQQKPFALQQSRLFASSRFQDDDDDDEDYFMEADDEDEDFFIQYPPAAAKVQQKAPGFRAAAVLNEDITEISLADYRGKYVVLFFYPKDFTYVCPTEIIAFNDRAAEFEALDTQLIAVSTDSAESHLAWTRLPRNKGGLGKMTIPIVSDLTKLISAKYGVLLENDGIALRGLFIMDREGVLQQITVNNLPIGRSVDETLRLIQALQFVEEHGEVCPANWTPGAKTIQANPKDAHQYFSTVQDGDDEDDANEGLTLIKNKHQFDTLVASGKPVVAKFMAPWCGKCAQILPFVQELAKTHPDVTFAKLDASLPEVELIKEELGVDAFPAFRFFKGGKEVGTPVSGYKKSLLKEAVNKLA